MNADRGLRGLFRRIAVEDDGMTLIEMIVGLVVMSIFMVMFTGVMFTLTNTTSKVQAVANTASQINTAFLKLDKLVRYSDAVTTPGVGTTTRDWYVELDSLNSAATVETCTQLRIDNSIVEQRTWTATDATHYASLSGWTPLANEITNGTAPAGSASQPFTFPAAAATASSPFQRLTVTVVSADTGPNGSTTRSQMTFTALNSLASATTNTNKCQQVGRP